jgi:Fe-S cluster assembly protein SufD
MPPLSAKPREEVLMNIHAGRQKTAVETQLIEAFGARVGALPGNAAVVTARDEAVEQLKLLGLPTRRVEAWHYTDLRTLLRQIPAGGDLGMSVFGPLVNGSTLLRLLEGEAQTAKAPEGVTVTALSAKLEDGTFARALALRGEDDAIGAINTAFLTSGYHVAIAPDTALEAPLEIQNIAAAESHTRLAFNIGNGVKATIIDRQLGGDAFVSAITHVMLGEGAEIVWVIDQERSEGAAHLAQFNCHMAKDSRLTLFVMNSGSNLARQEINVDVKGQGAKFTLRGVNLIGGSQFNDITMRLDHSVENTSSTEIIRNVVNGKGRGVFQGQIMVKPGAQKTDAKMSCNTLLLSDDAEFSAKPELEIFADDVVCGHGATVTEIDKTHLFYLMARGIPEADARGLLVKAFIAEIIEELEDAALVEALETRLSNWLEAHA